MLTSEEEKRRMLRILSDARFRDHAGISKHWCRDPVTKQISGASTK